MNLLPKLLTVLLVASLVAGCESPTQTQRVPVPQIVPLGAVTVRFADSTPLPTIYTIADTMGLLIKQLDVQFDNLVSRADTISGDFVNQQLGDKAYIDKRAQTTYVDSTGVLHVKFRYVRAGDLDDWTQFTVELGGSTATGGSPWLGRGKSAVIEVPIGTERHYAEAFAKFSFVTYTEPHLLVIMAP